MEEQNIRMAIDRHWAASATGDQVAEHEIYHDDVVCEYPQSGEFIAVGVTCRPFVAIILAGHRNFRSAGSWERAISGSPGT